MRKQKFYIKTIIEGVSNSYCVDGFYKYDMIEYSEPNNDKMHIDFNTYVVTRETDEFIYYIELNSNDIKIYWKEKERYFIKDIRVINIKYELNSFSFQYYLVDEGNSISYSIKF